MIFHGRLQLRADARRWVASSSFDKRKSECLRDNCEANVGRNMARYETRRPSAAPFGVALAAISVGQIVLDSRP